MGGFLGGLAVAALVAALPGCALLLALGVRRPLLFLGLAVPASVAVASWTGNIASLVGLPFGWVSLGGVTLGLLAIAAVLEARRQTLRGMRLGVPLPRRSGLLLVAVVSALLAATTVLRTARTWWSGLGGSLDTVPQEHDMVMHVLITAFVARTGHGATWELAPVDLLNGGPSGFYPAGFHVLAAVAAQVLGGDVVAGVNAMTVVMVALAGAAGTAALAATAARRTGLGRTSAILAAAVAITVAAGLYRPVYQLVHDGGVLANVVAFCLLPGVLAGLLALRRVDWPAVFAVGAAAAGLVTVHPSAIASLGVTILGWWLGEVFVRRERSGFLQRVGAVAIAAVVAVVLSVPTLLGALAVSARTAGFPVDTPNIGGPRALGLVFGFPYSGFIDPTESMWQVGPLVLLAVGAATLLVARRGGGPLGAFLVWSAFSFGRLVDPTSPVVGVVAGFFYNAWNRMTSHLSVLAPVIIALGVVVIANSVASWLRRRSAVPTLVAATAIVMLISIVYIAVPARHYAATSTEAVSTRYVRPDFDRVGPDDDRAIDFLASVVQPGQRVMNSANDGSTYLYVYRGIPVVNIGTLGLDNQPYTYQLLADFDLLNQRPDIGRLVRQLDIKWVYVDDNAPTIGSSYSPGNWLKESSFTTAPGLRHLDTTPGLTRVFRSGSVSVYAVNPPA